MKSHQPSYSQKSSTPSQVNQPAASVEGSTVSNTCTSLNNTASNPRIVVISDSSDSNTNMTILNQSVSRKNSKVSLKSSSSSDGCNNKDDIIASMVKDRMRELEESQDTINGETHNLHSSLISRANSHDATSDQISSHQLYSDLTRGSNNNQVFCDVEDGQGHPGSAIKNNGTTLTTAASSSSASKGTINSGGNSNRNSIGPLTNVPNASSNANKSNCNTSTLSQNSSNSSSQNISQSFSNTPSSSRKYSRSHQRRFHRRFTEVDSSEMLIDWFNCALIADILLQGYLYISDNYFAFYSNIFGYKTRILIPVSDVVSVTKEKTAKIFPNAVGICTDEAKYVFGSLISRESAYRLMQEVWRSTLYQVASVSCLDRLKASKSKQIQETDSANLSGCSISGSNDETLASVNRSASSAANELKKTASLGKHARGDLHINEGAMMDDQDLQLPGDDDDDNDDDDDDDDDDDSDESQIENIGDLRSLLAQRTPVETRSGRFYGVFRSVSNISRSSLGSMMKSRDNLMLIATLTLILLFISATFLIYRASRVQSRLYNLGLDGPTVHDASGDGSADDTTGGPWFSSINRNSLLFSNQVNRITSKLQTKIHEVTDLRVELEQLLKIVLQIQTSNSANNEQLGNCEKAYCT